LDSDYNYPEKVKLIIEVCHEHATCLLNASKTILENNDLPNIAYHLATLALEEIGKAEIVKLRPIELNKDEESTWGAKQVDDHEKKIFWAIFNVYFGKEVITKEKIETFSNISQKIHTTRIKGLYVDTEEDNITLPKEKINKEEAKNLIELVEVTLEREKNSHIRTIPKGEDLELLKWFLNISDDREKRKYITSIESQKKLIELGNAKEWFTWLKEQFDEAEDKSKKWAQEEISKVICDSELDKWKFRVRLFTNSHTVNQKNLNWFNGIHSKVKLYAVDKNINALDVEYILPKSVHVTHLYWSGWGSIRAFVTALNIGSMGYFWWYIPEQVSKYYNKLVDLEKGNDVIVERNPRLKIGWKKGKLSENDLKNATICIGMMPSPTEVEKIEPFNLYLTGLMFLSKNDIHFQFEIDAFRCFFNSFKEGIKQYDIEMFDEEYEKTFRNVISELIPKFNEIDKYYNIGIEINDGSIKNGSVTLEHVGIMKTICDAYFITTFKRLHKENENISKRKEN